MNSKHEKEFAIAQTVIETADLMIGHTKELHVFRKKLRFKYNRRPMKKKKTALVLLKMAITQGMMRARISAIVATPISKFPNGA